ncbi:hypothetical protein BVX99_00895 [bacterium F16]|nr:hypothetical protein BVX99_00895 [bacterium F16]
MKTSINNSIGTSALLIILGVAGYIIGGFASITALIPACFGIAILAASAVALKNERLGKRVAILFGVLGAIAPLGRLIPIIIKGKFVWGLPTISQILMMLVCAAFVALCLKSSKKTPTSDA